MNIAVIGIGGVGGYFGGMLARLTGEKNGYNIHFIARGEHLKEIQRNGLVLKTDDGETICRPTSATDSILDLTAPDVCLVCVKSYDLDSISLQLSGIVSGKTMILPLLNGVDIYERMRARITDGIIFPSCVYITSHIEKPGMVVQSGSTHIIHFGRDPRSSHTDPAIFELLAKAGINYNWLDNPYTEIWSKFLFIASFGLVTTNFNKTLGEVYESEELGGHVKNIIREIAEIAAKKNVRLPATIVEDTFVKGAKFPHETKTSLQRDYESGRKNDERDLFGGTVIRMGRDLGVKTEATEFVYNMMRKNL